MSNLRDSTSFPAIARHGERASLMGRLHVADCLMLAAFALALYIVADPLDQGLERVNVTKHLPLIVDMGALLLALLSHALKAALRPVNQPQLSLLYVGLPLAILGAWVVIGSCFARFADGIQDTFLNTGLYLLAAFSAAWSVKASGNSERLVVLLCRMFALASAYMILRMAVIHDVNGGRYHEMEFLVIPMAVYFALRPTRHGALNFGVAMFFLLGGALIMKNTAFIVIGITSLYLWVVRWRFYFRYPVNAYRLIVVVTLGLLLAGTVALQFSTSLPGVPMPSGNPGYRVRTYERAITRFEQSPVWGTLFDARSTAQFVAFQIDEAGGQLPTHSDILDLAAHGGVLALGLLVWGYIRVGKIVTRLLLSEKSTTEFGAAAHMFFCASLSAIAVYGFNPIMLQPDKALLVWGPLGVLLGCCAHKYVLTPFKNGEKE